MILCLFSFVGHCRISGGWAWYRFGQRASTIAVFTVVHLLIVTGLQREQGPGLRSRWDQAIRGRILSGPQGRYQSRKTGVALGVSVRWTRGICSVFSAPHRVSPRRCNTESTAILS